MSGRSIQELNAQLIGDYRFFNHSLKDYSSNGNDLSAVIHNFGAAGNYFLPFSHSRGMRCYTSTDTDTYVTFPSVITGSFTIELLMVRGILEGLSNYFVFYDSTNGFYIDFQDDGTLEVDFGSTDTAGGPSIGTSYGLFDSDLCHLVYTREITTGPILNNEDFYLNNYSISGLGASGTGDVAVNSIINSMSSCSCFYYKIYNDYITSDEVDTLYHSAISFMPNELFPHPVYEIVPLS